MKKFTATALICTSVLLVGCQTKPPADAFKLSESSLQDRQTQTRLYETTDEKALLSAGVGVLQDMGYTLDESDSSVGLITASKTVDATDTGQIVASIFIAALAGSQNAVYDTEQKIRVSFVTYPSRSKDGFIARATFQRVVWNSNGMISRVETLTENKLYEEYFDKLSKSVFLEGQKI